MALLMACGNGKNAETDVTNTDAVAETPQEPKQKPHVDDFHGIKPASVDTMEMVVDRHGNVVGRLVSNNANTYTISVQDDSEVSKIGNKIVTFRAKDGQGILYTKRKHVNIRQQPNLESTVIGQISYEDGYVPETYPCLGKTDEWYKIKVDNKVGYVRHDLVEWDGMNTF
jgi:hypothetical protein